MSLPILSMKYNLNKDNSSNLVKLDLADFIHDNKDENQ